MRCLREMPGPGRAGPRRAGPGKTPLIGSRARRHLASIHASIHINFIVEVNQVKLIASRASRRRTAIQGIASPAPSWSVVRSYIIDAHLLRY
jgi:hypothetical protein